MNGICTVANDVVYDQLVALLNSIEVNLGQETPVCVYPFDDNIDAIKAEINKRPNVELYFDPVSIAKWENFAKAAWENHPTAFERWQGGYYRTGFYRRYCAFDGPFDNFIYFDADTLILDSVEPLFSKLDEYDCVVYDYQYKNPKHVYVLSSPKLTEIFSQERIAQEVFCAGIYASKKDLFSEEKLEWLLAQLKGGEAEVLYPMGPDQTLLNYMMMRGNVPIYNYALHLAFAERFGNCVTDPNFVFQDGLLYDKGLRIMYLHYIGLSASLFTRVCSGENVDFPYREIFLHYRYLHEPSQRPPFTTKPIWYHQPPSLAQRALGKLKRLYGKS